MFAAQKCKMGYIALTKSLLWVVCYPLTRTCNKQPAYQIWTFVSTHLRRCERQLMLWRFCFLLNNQCGSIFGENRGF